MNKPLTVARQELIENLIEDVNKAQLPAFIILDVLKDLQMELSKQAETQLESDKKAYEQAQNEKPEAEVIDTPEA